MKQRLIVFAGAAAFVGLSVVGGELGELALPQAGGLTAYSMLTQDGRRLVSRVVGTNVVFELVATNALPKDLPPGYANAVDLVSGERQPLPLSVVLKPNQVRIWRIEK